MPRALLHVRALASLQLTFRGRPHPFVAPPRTLPLLAYLVLHRSAPVARDLAAYVLWPDDAEEAARTNLRRHVYHLQKALPQVPGVAWLRVTAKTVQWNGDSPQTIDLAEFERLSANRDRAAAVELYAGDAFEGVDEEWVLYERERLRNLQAANLIALIEEKRAQRDLTAALSYAQRLLAHDPWREDAIRHVMSLRYESGDRAGAMAEYERFRERLRAEMRVDPMPETAACMTAIVGRASNGTPLAGMPSSSATVRADRWALLPFAGRASEIERLREAWQRSRSVRGSAVLVGGEAGIGKTRLVTTFAQQIADQGASVLRGATSFPEATPYQALAAALRCALADLARLDIEPIWLAALADVIPELGARRLDRAAPAMHDSGSEERRLFEAFARVLEALGRQRPLLLVLEDLHWAGTATVSLLESLVCRAALANVLVVATYRDEEVLRAHPLRALRRRLALQTARSQIALGPLDQDAIEDLLRALLDVPSVSPEVVADLQRRSAGNPFFLTELLRDANAAATIHDGGDPRARPADTELAVSAGINAIVRARLRRLSPPALAAAHVAAVIGQAFNVELLRETAGWSEAQTLAALDELQDHQIVHDAGASAEDFAFSHHFVQAAAYAEIEASDRQRRHRRVARVMQELYPDQHDPLAAQLARHVDLGGHQEAAAPFDLRAAQHALAVYAADDARIHAHRALEHSVEPATCARAYLLLEEVHRRRGDREAQARELAAFELLRDRVDDRVLHLEGLRRRIALAHVCGDEQTEIAAIAQLHAAAAQFALPQWTGIALHADGIRLIAAGRLDDAHAAFTAALQAIDGAPDPAMRIETYCSLAQVAVHQTRFDEATTWLDRAEAIADADVAEYEKYRILRERYALARFRDESSAVYALTKDLLERSRQIGDSRTAVIAQVSLGNAALALFDVAEARVNIDRAYEMLSDVLSPKERFGVITCKGLFHLALGDNTAARTLFEEAHAVALAHGDTFSQVLSNVNLASVACAQQEYVAALWLTEDLASRAINLSSKYLEATALAARGVALYAVGRLEEARTHLESSVLLHRELSMQSTMGSELATLALLYVDVGDFGRARSAANEVVSIAAESYASLTNGPFMLWSAARVFHCIGDEIRACSLRDAGYALYCERRNKIDDRHLKACFSQMHYVDELAAARHSSSWPRHNKSVDR